MSNEGGRRFLNLQIMVCIINCKPCSPFCSKFVPISMGTKGKHAGFGGEDILFTYNLTFKPFTIIYIDHPGVLRIKEELKKITSVLIFAIIIFSFLILNLSKNRKGSRCPASSPNQCPCPQFNLLCGHNEVKRVKKKLY